MKKSITFLLLICNLFLLSGCAQKAVQPKPHGQVIEYSIEEIMENVFFSLQILQVSAERNIQNFIPENKNTKFLSLNVELLNLTDTQLPISYADFPLTVLAEDGEELLLPLETFLEEQLPDTFLLEKGEGLQGLLVYEVPKKSNRYILVYQEIYSDDFIGNTHKIYIEVP